MSNKKATVWSSDTCQWCKAAKDLLVQHGYEIEELKVWSKNDLLTAVPGARTIPQIFINGEYIGGFNSLKGYLAK